MPIKRRRSKARQYRITPELIASWQRLLEIQAADDDKEWEPEGRRREYLDGTKALHSSLGLYPWEASPLDVREDKPAPLYPTLYASSWPKAQELRRELAAEVCAKGRSESR